MRLDQMLSAPFQPGHPSRYRGTVTFAGVARPASEYEVPDLMQVSVFPPVGHEDERDDVVYRDTAGADAGELGAAVRAPAVLVAAQRVAYPSNRCPPQVQRCMQVRRVGVWRHFEGDDPAA